MPLQILTEGSIFADRYRVIRALARGGMGAVYEVVHSETERVCALKVMLPSIVHSNGMRERFRQEARVAAHIQSEFIVDVLDAGIDIATEMPFIVMELLRGEELNKRLKRVGRFDPGEVVTYLYQAALALDKTHNASIVHRDLKLENLFLTEREDGSTRVKLLDFGIAKIIMSDAPTTATSILGTPMYMAPEQFRMNEKIGPAADIYALGMIAFSLLVGSPYWSEEAKSGANLYAFLAVAVNGPQEAATVRAERRGVAVPAAFDAWFATATALAAVNRFPKASIAVLKLAEALGIASPLQRKSSNLEATTPSVSTDSNTAESSPPAPPLGTETASLATASNFARSSFPRAHRGAIAIGVLALAFGGMLILVMSARKPSGFTDPGTSGSGVESRAEPRALPVPSRARVEADLQPSATPTASSTAVAASPMVASKVANSPTPGAQASSAQAPQQVKDVVKQGSTITTKQAAPYKPKATETQEYPRD